MQPDRDMSTPAITVLASAAPGRRLRSIAAPILAILSTFHGVAAFVFVAGGRTSANEVEGFLLGLTASVLLVGAIVAHGLVRLRRELRRPPDD